MGMFLRRGPAPRRTRMSDLEIGKTIKLNVNGTPWEFLIVHQGLPSDLYDTSCDGTWVLMKDIYGVREWNSSKKNIYETGVNTWLDGDFFNLLDSNIRSAIKQVKIPYRENGGPYGADKGGADGLLTKVFMLSIREVGATTGNSLYNPVDGAKLDYFEIGTTTVANNKRIAYRSGIAKSWWLRSPYTRYSYSVCYIKVDGSGSNVDADAEFGIRPAFILPSDFIVTDDMLA